jgi:2-oxoglutarate dehydrogenase E2 component (dihydrolipoamide succinyltransferase)
MQIVVPTIGESVTEGVIASWRKQPGDWVERDETVAELETDKITMEIPAPAAGRLGAHRFAAGATVSIGAVLGEVDETAAKPAAVVATAPAQAPAQAAKPAQAAPTPPAPAATPAKPTAAHAPSAAPSNGSPNATPLARKVAEEHGVNLAGLVGTGAGGRIREQDVLAFVQSSGRSDAPAPAGRARAIRVERLSPLRQRVAARLVEAQQTAAMLTTFNECDMTAVMDLRKRHKDAFGEKHGVGLGFMSFFVKAVVRGLKAQPAVNSFITTDAEGKPATQGHGYCDIAVAVASPKGLVVPVLRDADTLSFAQIESGIKDLAVRARDGKITLEEMTGGTFTITNGGIFGSLMSTPILNPPQSGILGMHAIKNRAVEDPTKPGQIALRPMMYLALSYDHRIVDGEGAVKFLVAVKEAIEDPEKLLLDL